MFQGRVVEAEWVLVDKLSAGSMPQTGGTCMARLLGGGAVVGISVLLHTQEPSLGISQERKQHSWEAHAEGRVDSGLGMVVVR